MKFLIFLSLIQSPTADNLSPVFPGNLYFMLLRVLVSQISF
jgi:hypothetical protein